MWIDGDGVFKQRKAGVELALLVIAMGVGWGGVNTKVKRIKQIHHSLPTNSGLLWKVWYPSVGPLWKS